MIIIILCEQRGRTALMQASDNYHDEIARLLVDKGAKLDFKNNVI